MLYKLFSLLVGLAFAQGSIKDCDPSSQFRFTELGLTPDPPKVNENVIMKVLFHNPGPEVTEGKAVTSVTWNGIPITPSTKPLCESTECPLTVGLNNRTTISTWPSSVTGSVNSKIQWFDSNGKSLLCIQTSVHVASDDSKSIVPFERNPWQAFEEKHHDSPSTPHHNDKPEPKPQPPAPKPPAPAPHNSDKPEPKPEPRPAPPVPHHSDKPHPPAPESSKNPNPNHTDKPRNSHGSKPKPNGPNGPGHHKPHSRPTDKPHSYPTYKPTEPSPSLAPIPPNSNSGTTSSGTGSSTTSSGTGSSTTSSNTTTGGSTTSSGTGTGTGTGTASVTGGGSGTTINIYIKNIIRSLRGQTTSSDSSGTTSSSTTGSSGAVPTPAERRLRRAVRKNAY